MNGKLRVGIVFEHNFERVKIKRGARVKEFLYKLCLMQSFDLVECEPGQFSKFRPV